MNKRIPASSTSPRIGGNSGILADVFTKGAEEAGRETKKICFYDKKIELCKGCLGCQTTRKCILCDDAERIIAQMKAMDVLVFATPVYFYGIPRQTEILLGRTNPLFPAKHGFRDIYLLATSTDEEESPMEAAMKGLGGRISCFEKSHLVGVVRGTDADGKGAIEGCGEALSVACEMSRNIQEEAGVISLITAISVTVITFK